MVKVYYQIMITKRDKKGRIIKGSNYKHGMSTDPLYHCWIAIKARCLNPHHPEYRRYGGRGITICDRWINDFSAFLRDMGPKPSPKHSIDRVDVNGNYNPANCRWATTHEQNANRRDNNEVCGVYFDESRNKWRADLTVRGKKYFLGRFYDKETAIKARKDAFKKYV